MSETDRLRWDDYVISNPASTCYHQGRWRDVIEDGIGNKTFYLFSEDDEGKVNGILPIVKLSSRFFGSMFVSLAYFNYGGICADSEVVRDRLLREAIVLAEKEGVDSIEFRHMNQNIPDLPVKTAKVTMRLRLPHDPDHLWNSYPSKLRTKVRRAEREGMSVSLGREDQLDAFYRVFSVNMRDLGTPVYAKSFFHSILRNFPDTSRIMTVYSREGEPVASGFLLSFRDTLEIPWASSLRHYNRYKPNMLLYWKILELACREDFGVFDFGRCTPDSGTFAFKQQWGAEPLQLYWYYWLKNGAPMPDLNPGNSKYHMAIRLWQRLPVSLTNLVGPHIVKNLP